MKIIHVSDIHWRGLSRHKEYRDSFADFFKKAKKLSPDVIYVGGDIVHSKTQGISPELIDCLSWWFTEMAKICPVHVILGNHDGLILNKQRQDAITPILSALDNSNIFLYKESGVYPTGVSGFNWCVFSCFDEESWDVVKPADNDSNINIALYHGGVIGSLTDINWEIKGEITSDFFSNFDFALLGDIHKCQFLTKDKTIAYSGSAIQQNYGEDPGKGFLFWDIRSKEDFDVSFVKIDHSMPFVTIDWKGTVEATVEETTQYKEGSRFRVRSDRSIQQADIKLLATRLKSTKQAEEVVYKIDQKIDPGKIESDDLSLEKRNLRDPAFQKNLMRSYHKNAGLSKVENKKFDELIEKIVSNACRQDHAVRNTRWSLKRLMFDNTFVYGKENTIDFDNMPGISGIFGKNRSGKSSIIGTLMYGLFNTTDRGPVKNIHIINSRKSYCRTMVDFTVNSCLYRAERFTVKNETRKGDFYATTALNLFKIDHTGEVTEDLSGEQRRETEKTLKQLIGNSDDFLLTSLARQGEMNTFIKEKATARKLILSRFLDLDIFEKMYEISKEESASLRALAKSAPEIDYDSEIKRIRESGRRRKNKISTIEGKITKKRKQCQELKIEIAISPDRDCVSLSDLRSHQASVTKAEKEINTVSDKIKDADNNIRLSLDKIKKIENVINEFSIDEVKEKIQAKLEIEKSLIGLEHEYTAQKLKLTNQKKSVDILLDVPCGDSYPSCKFIKDSHKNKTKLESQNILISSLLDQVKATKKACKVLDNENLESQVEKYDLLVEKLSALKIGISKKKVESHELASLIESKMQQLEESQKILTQMEINVTDAEESAVSKLKRKVSELTLDIGKMDSERISIAEEIGQIDQRVTDLKEEKKKYLEIKKDLKLYDMFMQGASKKGIPLQIIRSQLPLINSEILKILQGATGFTVTLEADQDSNAMDIYIDYGDSKRVIEIASGMEKMMASLAIRVALINISSLPKCDTFIIDEGFGTLDETNVAACNSLLVSLKKWFKNIILISHVDGVKDAVDNVIDISWNGKDAKIRY
jgi:DNA repair exonuclease SbcCD ATPase subunit/DNA repair exonuclease SbcCD nuclease subunit